MLSPRIEYELATESIETLSNPDESSVLWHDEIRAGVYVPAPGRARGYLITEVSYYEPMGSVGNFGFEYEDGDDPSFMTTGTQELVDLSAKRVTDRNIEYVEGDIQGLVYAVDAMLYGGRLLPEVYQKHIEDWVQEFRAEKKASEWQPLGTLATDALTKLGLIAA